MFEAKNYAAIFKNIPDDSRQFPDKAFQVLQQLGLFARTLPSDYKKSSLNKDISQSLLELLFEVGRGNLSVGRIYEGHINALLLINTFGNSTQKEKYFKDAAEGKLFGVWNTEIPKEGLKLEQKLKITLFKIQKNTRLVGAKTFCSGALNIKRPLITVYTKNGPRMLILEIEKYPQLKEDWSLWNPIGMRSSVSCRIDFTDITIAEDEFLGKAGDYYKEPYFSWGAVRFSAVQLGGAQAILDITIKHLQSMNRTSDPYQKIRIGKMAILLETGKMWIKQGNIYENSKVSPENSEERINFSNMMRTVTSDICNDIIALAEKAVGVQGTMIDHPLERAIRDLRVYLKQAGPDAALAGVGNYIAGKYD